MVGTYEAHGDRFLRLLAQEERVPAFRQLTDIGRRYHKAWVARVFSDWLAKCEGAELDRLMAQLTAICDLYFWKILRRDLKLSRQQTELATVAAIRGLEPTIARGAPNKD